MNDISKRPRTSVRMGALDGDKEERAICAKQMLEAATALDLMAAPAAPAQEHAAIQELRHIAEAKRFDRTAFDDDTAFADWAQSRARWTLAGNSSPAQEPEAREWMPLQGTPFAVRMDALSEGQAQRNHGQSLADLKLRQGLAISEALALVEQRAWWRRTEASEAFAALAKIAASAPVDAQMEEIKRELCMIHGGLPDDDPVEGVRQARLMLERAALAGRGK
jgi:hypothetical protein